MKASKMIAELQKAIDKVGDLEVCMVHPTGVEYELSVLTHKDYYDDGKGMLGGDCSKGMITIDYDNY